jgi:single-stranded-DNA-specific exonuclease
MDDAKSGAVIYRKDTSKALEFAEMLHSDNGDRKEADSSITEEALAVLTVTRSWLRKSTVVYKGTGTKAWGHSGKQVNEKYYRPTVVLTLRNIVNGSARSGFNL